MASPMAACCSHLRGRASFRGRSNSDPLRHLDREQLAANGIGEEQLLLVLNKIDRVRAAVGETVILLTLSLHRY